MEIIDQLIAAFQQTTWLERLATLFGVVQVLLAKNNKVSTYLFGIVSIVLTMYVLFGAKLYAEIFLQLYYLIMSVYGWWYWHKQGAVATPISTCSAKDWQKVVAVILGGFTFFYFFLQFYTDSDVPVWDASVTATAWAGMWLLAKRKIENWLLLNVSNFLAIPLLMHKELYLFALLTVFFFVIAIFGYLNWKKIMYTQQKAEHVAGKG